MLKRNSNEKEGKSMWCRRHHRARNRGLHIIAQSDQGMEYGIIASGGDLFTSNTLPTSLCPYCVQSTPI